MDNNHNCIPHINDTEPKLTAYYNNSLKLTSELWGIDKTILKTLYRTIIERITLYLACTRKGGTTLHNMLLFN